MRLLLLADIHANLEALEAVLKDAATRGYSDTLFLGDAVGYGADAGAVVQRLRSLSPRCIIGNHEQMLLSAARTGKTSDTPVGLTLKLALSQLSPDDLEWLRGCKQGIKALHGSVECFFVHGSPRDPNEYVDNLTSARAAFSDWSGIRTSLGFTRLSSAMSVTCVSPRFWRASTA